MLYSKIVITELKLVLKLMFYNKHNFVEFKILILVSIL